MATFCILLLCQACGTIFVRSPEPNRVERLVLQFYIGIAIVAPVLLAIGSFSIPIAKSLVIGGGVLAGLVLLIRVPDDLRRGYAPAQDHFSAFEWTCWGTGFIVILLGVISQFAPVTNWDAAVAHAALPAAYARDGRIHLAEGNVYSAYPQMFHALAALGVGKLGPSAGATTFVFAVLAWLSVYALGGRLGGRTAGIVGAASFSTAPIFISQVGTASIDVPFAGLIAAALLSLVKWSGERRIRHLVTAGVIVGASCGIRHTGYVTALLMFCWVMIEAKEKRAKSASVFALAAFAASAPWWLRSWLLVGNPVYPLLTSVFGDGGMPDVQVTAPLAHETARHAGVLDAISFPWRIVMYPDQFDGWQASAGGLILALGVVGTLTGGRRARWLGGFSLAGVATIYTVQRFARYLFPFLAPLYDTAGLAAVRSGPLRKPIMGLLVFTYIYGVGLAVGTSYFKWPVVFGRELREEYLSKRVERYPAFAWINAHTPEDATVLTLDPRSYYIHRASFQNLAAIAQLQRKSIDAQVEWLKARGIRYILVPEAYVAASPIFRERGITPVIDAWRADARFRTVYSEDLPDPRGRGAEHVTILEVAGGNGSGTA